MSKAPKQRKVQLHYQPYQQPGAANAGDGAGLLAATNAGPTPDYGLSDLPLHMDPVLAGFSSNLSRNLWDDWNENDPNLVKFDMFSDDSAAISHAPTSSANASVASNGFMASMMHPPDASSIHSQLQQQLSSHQQNHSHGASVHVGHRDMRPPNGGAGVSEPMELDSGAVRPQSDQPVSSHMSDFHPLHSQPRLNVKRSLSEDLVSMLDEDDGHDAFMATASGGKHAFAFPPTVAMHPKALGQQQQRPPQQRAQQQQQPQQLLVQHATNWLNGFPATAPPQQQEQQTRPQTPLSPASAARLEAHNQRPEPSPLERATAAISSTLVAVPNPCKESAPPETSATTTPTAATNVITPSPFSAFSFMNAAAAATMEPKSGEGTSETGAMDTKANPFANTGGMMMPGFMMYSMPMMGNYQAAAAAAAAMGMMPMGAMQMGPMGMPMGAMQMGPMGAMQMGPMGPMPMAPMGMQMGMPMMQMAASMGMPVPGVAGVPTTPGTEANEGALKMAPKTLQPKAAAVGPGASGNASFVSIARKPEEPEVSSILKSLMEEEAKKKEKKLERNRDSARESRKKQQTYVETLENGIKRLQINRDLVLSYRWGVTGGAASGTNAAEWRERVDVVTGASESFSTLQNPTNFQNLMRMNRQRRTLSLSRQDKERALIKCFVCIGKQLAGLRTRLLELQVFRSLSNPANAASQELSQVLNLTEDQRLKLECHSSRIFAQEVVEMVKLFKIFFALRAQAIKLNMMAPELERYIRDVCSMEQLQRLLQWTELHRATIEGGPGNSNALSLV